ncbi:rod shape-determining protein RodA [Candidatus Shapirobacteria bacterium CG09_land_8_20_14_0_10_38_17]|uniref:Probable peptidoglycan glycosyltransferase FtsW n=1 Tax=Candidatus Shapirobacteria bacterium CG09_land_8_20_14_0_10_38_17 TaxID=1974884 RepID=A0A2H0WRR7_9BACT|nr:MAG: rod shape-determining protein RodA [Candidatus Shapirobacteria bacterium CG09_land_8_20_14_0_10_38_17]
MKKFKKIKFDWIILGNIIFLTAISLLLLLGTGENLFQDQLVNAIVGFSFFIFFSFFPYQLLKKISFFLLISSLIFLSLPLILGVATRGATRWINLGSFSLQPSEIIKPFAISIIANQGVLLSFLLALPFAILIFIQPDLGSTLSLICGFGGVWISKSEARKSFLALLVLGTLLLPILWHFLAPFQKERITSFLHPQSDPLGSSYQSLQAIITVGSGKIFGRGLGLGTQSRLAFLPENHNDLIFASLIESFGLFGGILILASYCLLLWHLISIAKNSEDEFGRLLTLGIFSMLSGQIFINIGMNMGILPITGITLPLISYGGSSYLATMISLGMCHSVFRQSRHYPRELDIK